MNLSERTSDFWYNLKMTTLMAPYAYREMDRKFNINTKLRKLNENDPDLTRCLKGKVCVITGGTRGLGAEVVKVLLKKDCYVITGTSSKSEVETKKRYHELRAGVPEDKGKLEIWDLDLKSMNSVVEFTDKFKKTKLPLNYLIANAGISFHKIGLTQDKFEEHLAVNYLSHCLLIDRLFNNLYETSKLSKSESRIIMVSSAAHRGAYIKFKDIMLQSSQASPTFVYGQSKLALIMFAIRMSRWIKERDEDWSKNITINSLHPGVCNTELISHLPAIDELRTFVGQAFRSAKEGAETTIYATLSSQMNGITGKYLEDCAIDNPSKEALVIEDQNKLWNLTWKLLDKWTEHIWVA